MGNWAVIDTNFTTVEKYTARETHVTHTAHKTHERSNPHNMSVIVMNILFSILPK